MKPKNSYEKMIDIEEKMAKRGCTISNIESVNVSGRVSGIITCDIEYAPNRIQSYFMRATMVGDRFMMDGMFMSRPSFIDRYTKMYLNEYKWLHGI